MKFRSPKVQGLADVPFWLVYWGFWSMLGLCILSFVLFGTGTIASPFGLGRALGHILFGYVDYCMALLGVGALHTALGGFRHRDAGMTVWGPVFLCVFGAVLLTGSVWLLWPLITH
jgi:hypothetical protein